VARDIKHTVHPLALSLARGTETLGLPVT